MNNTKQPTSDTQEKSKPWWHYGHAWLVFGGPAAVVVASIITVYIAVSGRDSIVDENYYQNGININKRLNQEKPLTVEERNALEPAHKARNHAATGVHTQ